MAKKQKKSEREKTAAEKSGVFLFRGESFGRIYDGFLFKGTTEQLKEYFAAEFEKKPGLITKFEKLI